MNAGIVISLVEIIVVVGIFLLNEWRRNRSHKEEMARLERMKLSYNPPKEIEFKLPKFPTNLDLNGDIQLLTKKLKIMSKAYNKDFFAMPLGEMTEWEEKFHDEHPDWLEEFGLDK